MATHYDLLGIEPTATFDAIKRAYYDKARAFHPDAHAASPAALRDEAERAMRDLNEAWNTLRNPAARRAYDRAVSRPRPAPDAHTRRRRVRSGHPVQSRSLAIGAGFRYWLGSAAAIGRSEDGSTRLNLAVDGATDLAPLTTLAPNGLWALHAQGSATSDSQLRHIAGIRSLTFLDLSSTPLTDEGLVHLQGLYNLESLMLWDTAVTDNGLGLLAHLTGLRHLGLGNTAVGDAGLAHLFGMHRLRMLQLWGTQVTGHGLTYLHGLESLEIVTLPWKVRGRDRRRLRRALPGATIT